MARIEPKLNFLNLSASGKEITLQDKTSSYTNGSYVVEGVILKLTNAFSKTDATIEYDDTTNPTYQQVIDGIEFKINSVLSGDSTVQQGFKTFKDGVLEINYYPYTQVVQGQGTKGNHYIITTDSFELVNNFEAIVVGDNIYHIDKSKNTNAGTLLYLVEGLKEDVENFYPCYRGITRVLVDTLVKQSIAEGATALAYPHNRHNGLKEGVKTLIHNYTANKIWFDLGDYGIINHTTKENYQIIDLYRLGRC